MNAPGRTKFDDNKFESQEMIESSKLLFFGDTYSNCKGFMVMSFAGKNTPLTIQHHQKTLV